MAAYVFQPYPAWITAPNGDRYLVANAEAEAVLRSQWGDSPPAITLEPVDVRLSELSPLDHDADGKPGGSLKGAGENIAELRKIYQDKFGKRAFPGWSAEQLKAKLEANA